MKSSKLWEKGTEPDPAIIEFTSGKEKQTDLLIADWDIIGSMAHVIMLEEVKLLTTEEKKELLKALHLLFQKHINGELKINEGVEDIHSQVENELSEMLGPVGRKVHTGRSRNDQVLLDIRLFTRNELDNLAEMVFKLFERLLSLSDQHREVLLPGYTHMQPAMVSSFGLWFGGYAEAITDDLLLLAAAREMNNRNPLGTAAGYGTTLPLDRQLTAKLLEFDDIILNSSYASINRGKVEMTVAAALASIASTLSKLSMDICLFMTQEFSFIEFPDEMITGSSIMPQKKNPDVFELIRARCNLLQTLPVQIAMITSNLPSGYNRDLQLLKPLIINAFTDIKECLGMMTYILGAIRVKRNILDNPRYNSIFSTEEVNRLVKNGIPFRDAYKAVAGILINNTFIRTMPSDYSHEGSIGNLCNDKIKKRAETIIGRFKKLSAPELEEKLMKYAGI